MKNLNAMETLSNKIITNVIWGKKEEVNRLETLKREDVKEFIGHAFAEISTLLTPCMECAKDKRIDKVVHIFRDNFGEELI